MANLPQPAERSIYELAIELYAQHFNWTMNKAMAVARLRITTNHNNKR